MKDKNILSFSKRGTRKKLYTIKREKDKKKVGTT